MSMISHIYRKRQPKKTKKQPNIPLATSQENIKLLNMYQKCLGVLPYQSITKQTNYLEVSDEEWEQFFSVICEIDYIRKTRKTRNMLST